MLPPLRFRSCMPVLVAAAFLAGCAMNGTIGSKQNILESASSEYAPPVLEGVDSLQTPALLAVDFGTGALEYWPIAPKGGKSPPRTITKRLGLGSVTGMAANGDTLAIGASSAIVLHNVATKSTSRLPDPFGAPFDIAIDKNAALYVLNSAKPDNVAWYPAGSSMPTKLACNLVDIGESIAVDNEGDIFIGGFENGNTAGVVEIPSGPSGPEPQNCVALHLIPGAGTAGLAVDPKTDALVSLDNPGQCAGGSEGRMTIYPKPYQRSTAIQRVLGGNCTGVLRLNADSTTVFYGDEDVSASFLFIRSSSYPDGRSMGTYSGGQPFGFTTIPNTLPN